MCGIGGILSREHRPSIKDVAQRLLRALRHRGPDAQDIHATSGGKAVLVHSRLAILDPSAAGRQPMKRGDYCVTFNGELYNFRALRQELIEAGEQFFTETDTEVLLALYARDGPACLLRLRGMFAFAIWNEKDGSCFLARDRFGIKPLYYGFSPTGDLIFASELRAVMATGLIEPRLDAAGLESYLACGSVAEPLTMLADIRCLAAGHWLRWREGQLEEQCYYQISFDQVEESANAACERTRNGLLDTVRHHFVSDVPVGIFLSGGMDSGALVAAAKELGRDVATFSIGVEDSLRDESDAARRRAALFGTDHHEMLLTRELASHWVDHFLDSLDQPTIDGFNIYCASKLARDHGYRVVLSGLGGDELFGGYPSFARIPQLMRLKRRLGWMTGHVAQLWENHARTGHSARLAAYFGGEATLPRAYRTVRSVFSPLECKKIIHSLLETTGSNLGSMPEFTSPENHGDGISYLELTHYLRNQLLRDADVMSMAHGLELRVPFIDHEFFSILRTIPSTVRLARGKELLRKAVPELLEQAGGPKQGFTFPFQAWLGSTWSDLRSTLHGAPAVPLDSWARQWSLVVLNRWLRRHHFAGWEA